MKKVIIFAATLLMTSLVYGKKHDHNSHYEHTKHSNEVLTLNNGKKWGGDQTMIENMTKIIEENNRIKNLVSSKNVVKGIHSIF